MIKSTLEQIVEDLILIAKGGESDRDKIIAQRLLKAYTEFEAFELLTDEELSMLYDGDFIPLVKSVNNRLNLRSLRAAKILVDYWSIYAKQNKPIPTVKEEVRSVVDNLKASNLIPSNTEE